PLPVPRPPSFSKNSRMTTVYITAARSFINSRQFPTSQGDNHYETTTVVFDHTCPISAHLLRGRQRRNIGGERNPAARQRQHLGRYRHGRDGGHLPVSCFRQ